jgi:D-tyrosyl-tRNA(Tyr) deacylase
MRAVIQRVSEATITINDAIRKHMGKGMVVLVGIEEGDSQEDVAWLSGKISRLRIFDDPQGVMNLSIQETGGALMIVSQFTLHASTRKGNRPSYIRAAQPETAIPLYELFILQMEKDLEHEVVTGEFGAKMDINLTNTGPVTILIDTKHRE